MSPNLHSVAMFLSRTAELFIKLPLETVLRRGQASVLASQMHSKVHLNQSQMVVEPGPYSGVFGTIWSIVYEEGDSTVPDILPATGTAKSVRKGKKPQRKGQGIEGLWRGWRVGMWGLAGMWSARAMGGSGANPREF
jgi:fusion and transport protein UGO1